MQSFVFFLEAKHPQIYEGKSIFNKKIYNSSLEYLCNNMVWGLLFTVLKLGFCVLFPSGLARSNPGKFSLKSWDPAKTGDNCLPVFHMN